MSPEQIIGKPLDARSDVYSLAVVAFECITGESPLQKDRNDRPPNARVWVESFVEDLEKAEWIGQGWVIPYEHAPAERPDDSAPTERAIQITND